MRYRIAAWAAVVPAVLMVGPSAPTRAQAPVKGLTAPTLVQQALRSAESGALRDLPVAPPLDDTGVAREGRPNERVIRNRALPREDIDQVTAPLVDGMLQQTATPSEPLLTAPLTSFAGLTNQDNVTLFGFRVSPPDTVGEVGPHHYVQMTNLAIRVWDKTGTPLTAPAKTSSFWASLGGICALEDLGDPIVIYDDMADRWLVSQFNSEDTDTGPHHQCIGISKNGDPTGAWYLYDFVMPNQKFNDYPKFGAWRDAYYMTDNQFSPFAFVGAGAFAFDRAKMLVGDPTASYIYFDLEALDPFIGGLLPADADGIATPPAGAPGIFSFFTANEFGDPEGDGLRLFEFRATFATPASSTFTEIAPLSVASFDPRSPAGRRDIEQPGPAAVMPTHALDSISDRLLHRLQYRNFGSHESLVVTHTVNVGTGVTLATHQAGVRYYELRRPTGGAWTVNEQATYAPDTDNRWMGSAAMDGAGNLAVGYSVSSLTTFPSIRYAARLATDPANGLHQGEQTVVGGSGVQRSTTNRWGDYSSLTVDPLDDCTFWYTQEYYTAASQATSVVGWVTHIGSFRASPKCQASPRGKLVVQVANCETGKAVEGAFVEISNGMSRAVVDGRAEVILPPGRYTVRISAPGYVTRTERVTVTTNDKTAVVLCLRPVPIVEGVSAVLTGEACAPENGAIDPDERVTVAVTLRNVGADEARLLWAQVVRSASVDLPSPLQYFGRVDPGEEATRSVSFVARGSCGSTFPLTLRVYDGLRLLNTVSFPLTLGRRVESVTTASNPAAITIGDNAPATPYPSMISVSGVTTPIDKVTVTLTGFSHTWPADSVFVLVGPGGQAVTLMANRGNGIPVSGLTLTFDDDAARSVTVPIVSGTFRPSLGYGLPLPAPAPSGGASLGIFRGTSANGTWSLFVADQFNGDSGSVSGGWSLTINGVEYACTAQCALGTK